MISTWKKILSYLANHIATLYTKPNLQHSKRHLYCYYCYSYRSTATHTAVLLLIPLLIPLLILLLILLLIPLLILRERVNPCALCVAHTPAALLGGWPDPDPGWPDAEWRWPAGHILAHPGVVYPLYNYA